MRRWIFILLVGLALASCTSVPVLKESPTEFITNFYKRYFTKLDASPRYDIPFSESLQELIQQNQEVCAKEGTQGEVCGFGAGGDPYLDAQDFSPGLNFENSGFVAVEAKPLQIQVDFNLRPPEKSLYAHRKITFHVKLERNVWVVDDVQYSHGSVRDQMMSEIRTLRSQSR